MYKEGNFNFYVEDFMLFCTSKNLSKKTMKSYEQTLKLFALYLEQELQINEVEKVTSSQIRHYIKYLQERGKYTVQVANRNINFPESRKDLGEKVSPNTINNYIRNIKVFYNYLIDEEVIRTNPFKNIKFLKKRDRIKEALTEREIRKILIQFDLTTFYGYRNWIITRLLLTTGARVGEMLSVEEDDIDFKNKAIVMRDTKNKKERYAYLTHLMQRDLKRWISFKERYITTPYVFPTNRATKLRITSYEKSLKDASIKADVDNVYPHRLRATFAIEFIKNSGSIYVLSKLLDHSSVDVTKVYLNLTDKEIQEQFLKFHPLRDMDI